MSIYRCFRLAAGIFLTATASLSAVDLTLKSGEMLSGVSITGISSKGVQLRWPDGETRLVRLESLSPASWKTLSGLAFQSTNNSAGTGNSKNSTPVVLPNTVGNVYFHSVRILQGGTLGWAESAGNGTGSSPTQFGKVFISGLYIPQGNVWTGKAYSTSTRVRHLDKSYPCWALSPSAARRISVSQE